MQRIALVLTLVVIMALPSFAQGTFSVGVGLAAGLPTGDFNNIANFGIGGLAWGNYAVDQNLSVGLKTGYLHFGGKDLTIAGNTVNTSFGAVPIVVYGKYYFMPPADMRVYGSLDLGMYSLSGSGTTTVNGVSYSASSSSTKFGLAPSVGAIFKAGDKMNVDASLNYTYISTDNTSTTWLGVTVGLEFALQ